MRILAVTALVLAVSACSRGDEQPELAQGKSELSDAQIAAALGPDDQSDISDVPVIEQLNGVAENSADAAPDAVTASKEE